MSRTLAIIPLALALLVAPAASGAAQEKTKPEPVKEESVAKGLKSRIFEVKHRDPEQLFQTMRLLGSGAPGATMTYNRDLRTITARDYPENLATMEEALKRLDVAQAETSDVDLTIYVLEATKGGSAAARGDLPAQVEPAVAALKGTLAYKNYHLLTTFTQRVKDGTRGVRGGGTTIGLEGLPESTKVDLNLEFRITQVSVVPAPSGPPTVRLDGFRFEASHTTQTKTAGGNTSSAGRAAEMQTDVSLKEGEQVVVGTSVFRDRALILAVSAARAK